ncbi:MAG: response regulator transcription factor [Candidatus Manganitrophaceae bacterium]
MVEKSAAKSGPGGEEILIIEDHLDLVDILTHELTRHHYHVRVSHDGESGLAEAQRQPPSLITLDLMLPGLNGWEVCRILKKDPRTKGIPLLILTALGEETDRVKGFELGADDYLPKPFSLKELIARLRALLRRKRMNLEPHFPGQFRAGPLVIDTERHEIRMAGRLLHLTPTEFGLLKFFSQHPGKVFRRDELITTVWGEDRFVEEHNLDVHIHSIRQHLEPNPTRPRFLVTVRGVGYQFRTPEEEIGI